MVDKGQEGQFCGEVLLGCVLSDYSGSVFFGIYQVFLNMQIYIVYFWNVFQDDSFKCQFCYVVIIFFFRDIIIYIVKEI